MYISYRLRDILWFIYVSNKPYRYITNNIKNIFKYLDYIHICISNFRRVIPNSKYNDD